MSGTTKKTAINPTNNDQFYNARNNFLGIITQPGGPVEEAFKYLKKKGLLPHTPNLEHFETKLREIWFDSGGFQHTFVGDKKEDQWQFYSGFHNWLQFLLEQDAGRIQIQNQQHQHQQQQQQQQQQQHFRRDTEPPFMETITFEWNKYPKSQGASSSMFVGTSPAFEIALYTVCFIEHPDQRCSCHIGRSTVTVETHDARIVHGTENEISTAFPRNVQIEAKRCTFDPDYRTACGGNGIIQAECIKRGCCYDNTQLNPKRCFYPRDHKCDGGDPAGRKVCGYVGITRNQCETINCCFDESIIPPFCFEGNL